MPRGFMSSYSPSFSETDMPVAGLEYEGCRPANVSRESQVTFCGGRGLEKERVGGA
jgi:hypothetical protein